MQADVNIIDISQKVYHALILLKTKFSNKINSLFPLNLIPTLITCSKSTSVLSGPLLFLTMLSLTN